MHYRLTPVQDSIVSHTYLDHVGRVRQLLVAGFVGPTLCVQISVVRLPMMLADGLSVSFRRDRARIDRVMPHLRRQILRLPYKQLQELSAPLGLRLQLDKTHPQFGLFGIRSHRTASVGINPDAANGDG